MKMKSLLLTMAGMALMSIQSFAQNVAAPTTTSEAVNSDYVTIGSRVPYFVAPDATIQAMTTAGTMKQSIFKWTVTTATDAPLVVPILEHDGTAGQQYDNFRTLTAGTGYYDNEISIEWSATNSFSAGTQYKVKTTEKAVTLSTTVAGCEDATPEERNVFVLARPTVAFVGTEGGGCSVAPGDAFNVPLTVTGLGDWEVTYTVSYNGGAPSAEVDYTLTLPAPAVNDGNVITESTTSRPTGAGQGLVYTLPAGNYGFYDIKITNITDRISRKSLVALGASGTGIAAYRIYVNPTPVTSPIQHIANL